MGRRAWTCCGSGWNRIWPRRASFHQPGYRASAWAFSAFHGRDPGTGPHGSAGLAWLDRKTWGCLRSSPLPRAQASRKLPVDLNEVPAPLVAAPQPACRILFRVGVAPGRCLFEGCDLDLAPHVLSKAGRGQSSRSPLHPQGSGPFRQHGREARPHSPWLSTAAPHAQSHLPVGGAIQADPDHGQHTHC